MVEELGEVFAIIKKQSNDAIMRDADMRAHFTKEMCDALLMYDCDTLMHYDATADELEQACLARHRRSLTRFH